MTLFFVIFKKNMTKVWIPVRNPPSPKTVKDGFEYLSTDGQKVAKALYAAHYTKKKMTGPSIVKGRVPSFFLECGPVFHCEVRLSTLYFFFL